jgi:hypothetical protein
MWIGIDPGVSGAVVVMAPDCGVEYVKLSESPDDVVKFFRQYVDASTSYALIERVHSSPQMGVKSSFTFGVSYGLLQGICAAFRLKRKFVSPARWQTLMRCRTKGDKNLTKKRAQELFPREHVTHANADAMLLCELCRTSWDEI